LRPVVRGESGHHEIISGPASSWQRGLRKANRWGVVHAFPGVTNLASNGICRSLGFTLVGQEDVEFSDRVLRTNHWQIDSRTFEPTP
jgi:hypothetical protein